MGLHEFTLEWGQTESIEDWGLGTSPGTGDERELQSCVFDVFVMCFELFDIYFETERER